MRSEIRQVHVVSGLLSLQSVCVYVLWGGASVSLFNYNSATYYLCILYQVTL